MNLKRLIGSVAVAGVVGASTLGIGGGIANASPAQTSSGSVAVQPVDWHGGGHGHGYGPAMDTTIGADGPDFGGTRGAGRGAGECQSPSLWGGSVLPWRSSSGWWAWLMSGGVVPSVQARRPVSVTLVW